MRVAFRVDASPAIGSGHLMRCLTLAARLASAGCDIAFVCRQLPESLEALVREAGHDCIRLPTPADTTRIATAGDPPHAAWLGVSWETDAQESCTALAGGVDWLVVDHYGIDARWQGRLRDAARRIMVIDDLADRPHDCELLLDQNLYADMTERYAGRVAAHCRLLLGPRHALLRDEFATLRGRIVARDGEVRRLLVFLGGMDADNVTATVLAALEALPTRHFASDVVIGAGHPARGRIEGECSRLGLACHVQTPRMAELMAAADLAIGAGGTATWERCALGLPTLALCLADNQRQLIHDASRAGLLHGPDISATDAAAIARHLAALLDSAGLRRLLSATGMAAVDGRGAARVVRAMGISEIEVRPATAADSASLFAWRNSPEIRAVSRSSTPIPQADHARWLAAVLADPDRPLLIGARAGEPVGVVRFDIDATTAEVSIYLVPGKGGEGLGSALLTAAEAWLGETHPALDTLLAEVLGDNHASHRLFAGCGYALQQTRYRKRIHP